MSSFIVGASFFPVFVSSYNGCIKMVTGRLGTVKSEIGHLGLKKRPGSRGWGRKASCFNQKRHLSRQLPLNSSSVALLAGGIFACGRTSYKKKLRNGLPVFGTAIS